MGVSFEPTVSLAMMRGLLCAAADGGIAPAVVLQTASIHPDELDLPDARLGRSRFERACAVAIDLTGDEALGLRWAERSLRGSFGPISEGLAHAGTLRRAFHLLVRFERFFTNAASHQVIEGPQHTSVRLPVRAGPPTQVRRLWAELNTAWFIGLIRSMHAGAELTGIDFVYEAPRYRADYDRVFGHPVRFQQPFTEIVFPSQLLDAPTPDLPPPVLGATMSRTPRARIGSCAHRLRQLLLQRAPARLGMTTAARALGYSERSLRRRLAEEGYTFKEIEAAALSEVAKHLLLDGERTIQQTAHEMGFASLSAFHRAFKRWTGQSPGSLQVHASIAARS